MIKLIKRIIEKIQLFFFEIRDLTTSMEDLQKEILEDLEDRNKEAR